MNEFKVQQLLNKWSDLIAAAHKDHTNNTSDRDRIIIQGNKIDLDGFAQPEIVKELCEELPQLESLIKSEPYLENLEWKTTDCIEISFNHYNILIGKVKDYLRDL